EVALENVRVEQRIRVDDAAQEPEELPARRGRQLLLDVAVRNRVVAEDDDAIDGGRPTRDRRATERGQQAHGQGKRQGAPPAFVPDGVGWCTGRSPRSITTGPQSGPLVTHMASRLPSKTKWDASAHAHGCGPRSR